MKSQIKLLPLLVLFALIVVVGSADVFVGDEGRYVSFARNLTNGHYSPKDEIDLWNGPGYPIVLVPFVLLKLPWLAAKLLNALFLFLAILYFYRTMLFYVSRTSALWLAYLLGLYPPILRHLQFVLTEALAVFLICGLLFHFCRLSQRAVTRKADLAASSFFLGYLCLTKIFYGYVASAALLLAMVLFAWRRKPVLRRAILVSSFALLCCVPYLSYTYSLTGRVFYWGNSGGSALYWMSSPYEDESGTWFSDEEAIENPNLREKHGDFFAEIDKLPSIEKDDALKRRALENIIQHPGKYLKNWMANVGRLIFSYPYTYTPQKLSTYFYLLPNMLIAVLCALVIYPAYAGRRLIPPEVWASVTFAAISLGGASFLSGHSPRQSMLLVPIILLLIAVVFSRVVKVQLRK